jgi:hypothetical protein
MLWGGGGRGRGIFPHCCLFRWPFFSQLRTVNTALICRLVESTEWEALEQAELITLLSSDELAADEPFIIHSIIRQVRLLFLGSRNFG